MPDLPDYTEEYRHMYSETGEWQAPGHNVPQTHGYHSDVPTQAPAHPFTPGYEYLPAGQPQDFIQAAQPTHGYYSDVPMQAPPHVTPNYEYQPAGHPQAFIQAAQPTHGYQPTGQPQIPAHAAPQIHQDQHATHPSLATIAPRPSFLQHGQPATRPTTPPRDDRPQMINTQLRLANCLACTKARRGNACSHHRPCDQCSAAKKECVYRERAKSVPPPGAPPNSLPDLEPSGYIPCRTLQKACTREAPICSQCHRFGASYDSKLGKCQYARYLNIGGPGPESQYLDYHVNRVQLSAAYDQLLARHSQLGKEKTTELARKDLALKSAKLKTSTPKDSVTPSETGTPTKATPAK